ncbi:MAG: DUF6502 family protein [Gammaproteobacteria bacterium]
MSNQVREALLSACKHFMIPIARFLIQNGVTFKEFSAMAKLAFVEVASDEYGIRGRPTNVSRTAVLTGLTRKEVKRVRDEIRDPSLNLDAASLNRPAQVLSTWNEDARFLDNEGRPRVLSMEGANQFRDLLRVVGGDVPPGAMLTELMRAGCVAEVSEGEYQCVSRVFNPSGIDAFQAMRFGVCLHDLAATYQFNMSAGSAGPRQRRFERQVWNDQIPRTRVPKFEKLVQNHGFEMLKSFDKWLAENQSSSESVDPRLTRCGVGIYFFER